VSKASSLFPQLRVGMGFLGYGVLSGPELEALESQIRQILFPALSSSLRDHVDQAAGAKGAAARWHTKLRPASSHS